MNFLVIDDDPNIVENVALILELRWSDATITKANCGKKGIECAKSCLPDVVLLDIGLPDMDGYEVLQELRSFADVPVIMMSVRSGEVDKVRAFEMGADDYMTKPFSHLEFLARVRAVIRRYVTEQKPPTGRIEIGDLLLDLRNSTVYRGQTCTKLDSTECRLLAILLRNAGHVVDHETIVRELWASGIPADNELLWTYVSQLRKKMGDIPPTLLLVEHGIGYRLIRPA